MPELNINRPEEALDKIGKELYGDLNPNFYKDLIKKFSGKVADLNYLSRVKISSVLNALKDIDKGRLLEKPTSNDFKALSRFRPPYKLYSQLYEKVPELYQAVNICIDNMLSPDDLTKKSISVMPEDNQSVLDGLLSTAKSFVENIIETTELENKLPSLVKSFLLKGDAYCEIVPMNTYISNYKILTEYIVGTSNVYARHNLNNVDKLLENIDLTSNVVEFSMYEDSIRVGVISNNNLSEQFVNENTNFDTVYFKDKYFKSKVRKLLHENKCKDLDKKIRNMLVESNILSEDDKLNTSVGDILLIVHPPENVVVVGDKYNILGYLVISDSGSGSSGGVPKESLVDKYIDYVVTMLSRHSEDIKNVINKKPELKNELKYIITTQNIKMAKIRFVPYDLMQHFKIESSETYPYGESMLYPVKDLAKYVIVAETAMLIYRLTRAVEKYIYKVDVGKEKTRVKEILNELMRTQKQKLYAVTNAGDIDALLGSVTMFEDIYTAMIDGRDLLTVDIVQGGDMNTKIDDLNYFKEKLMASTPVPNIYLKQENEESKYTLAQENVRFARTIIRLQKDFSYALNELILKITYIVQPEMLAQVSRLNIHLKPPTALQMEREAEMLNNLSSIIQTLSDTLGLPKELVTRTYLSRFNIMDMNDIFQVVQKMEDITAAKSGEEEEE